MFFRYYLFFLFFSICWFARTGGLARPFNNQSTATHDPTYIDEYHIHDSLLFYLMWFQRISPEPHSVTPNSEHIQSLCSYAWNSLSGLTNKTETKERTVTQNKIHFIDQCWLEPDRCRLRRQEVNEINNKKTSVVSPFEIGFLCSYASGFVFHRQPYRRKHISAKWTDVVVSWNIY